MNKEVIFRKIGGIISEISEQYQYLASNPQDINPLELELLIANAHFLSEHLNILKKLDDSQFVNPQKPQDEHGAKTDLPKIDFQIAMKAGDLPAVFPASDSELAGVAESVTEIHVQSNSENQDGFEKGESFETIDEKGTLDRVSLAQESAIPLQNFPVQLNSSDLDSAEEFLVKPNKSDENPNLVTTNNDRVPTLNEVLSAAKDKNPIPAIAYNEVKDLKSMIKLNDKLLFVRDLFNGYSLAYSEAIELLNRYNDFKMADNFLKQNYAIKNKWSENQSTVDYFYEILNKRFN